MRTDRIQRLVRLVVKDRDDSAYSEGRKTGRDAFPSPCPADSDVVVDEGCTPRGEMAAPSFMILVARPRR
ncbi:hypothetical protein ACODT3_09675 [Streptomyces sp. 4.24]|uniref:hypothetical protein n=1 Tax=Streptomyces tritrimontium TaxID=3406573 RepID=UPI003BB7080D